MISILAATAVLSIVPVEPIPVTRCDILEENTIYDSRGNKTLHQWIAWEWIGGTWCDYYVVDWQMCRGEQPWRTGSKWRAVLFRDDDLRRVEAKQYVRTHTQYDPEIEDRKRLPVDFRCRWAR